MLRPVLGLLAALLLVTLLLSPAHVSLTLGSAVLGQGRLCGFRCVLLAAGLAFGLGAVALLLRAGAFVNVPNADGQTCLMAASERGGPQGLAIVDLLLARPLARKRGAVLEQTERVQFFSFSFLVNRFVDALPWQCCQC